MLTKKIEASVVKAVYGRVPQADDEGETDKARRVARSLGVSVTALYDFCNPNGKQRINMDTLFDLMWMSDRRVAHEFFMWVFDLSECHRKGGAA